jgi:glycosyltransferase involved in cell wall biosynthesis
MRSHLSNGAQRPTVYVDATPLSAEHLAGIGRYTARIAMALAARGVRVRFFAQDRELLPPDGLDWSPDQDLNRWGAQVWRGRRLVPLAEIPDDAVGLWTCTRPSERTFPVELSILHDLTSLIVPSTREPRDQALSQFFYARSLLSSDAALAVSHSTKADAGWLSDFPQDRIVVTHPGPSQCLVRHMHEHPVTRRPDVGLVVSTFEPRKNADFVIDWFRSSESLPDGTELWWVGRIDELKSPRLIRDLERSRGRRRIRFLGVVSDRRLCELYQSAGWSVHQSLYEGFGFPVLDSLRHGVPVLLSCHSSLREFAYPGVQFFDSHDPATLDLAWAECRAAGPSLVSKAELDEHYNWDRVARAILDMARGARPAKSPGLPRATEHLAARA